MSPETIARRRPWTVGLAAHPADPESELALRLADIRWRRGEAAVAEHRAFQDEIVNALDVWVRALDTTSAEVGSLSDFAALARQCWAKYEKRVARIRKQYKVPVASRAPRLKGD